MESNQEQRAAASPDIPPPLVGAAAVTESLRPISATERIVTLDVLRGFALLGIFMVNMQFFSMPFMKALFDPTVATAPPSEQAAWTIVKVFFEYKFISLFSLLFGIGFSVQLLRARSRHAPFVPVYLRRVAVLLCIGLAHGVLLWYGDILTFYSLISIGLLATFWMRAKALIVTAAVVFTIGALLVLAMTAAQVAFNPVDDPSNDPAISAADDAALIESETSADAPAPQPLRRFRDLQPGDYDPSTPAWREVETNALKYGPFSEAVIVRAVSLAMGMVFSLFGFGWHILAMFLLGAGLMKLDFFSAAFAGWHRLMAAVLLPIGLGLEGAVAYAAHANDHSFNWYLVPSAALHEFGSVATMLGYVGLWAVIVRNQWLRWLTSALAATGRMALTNYLTQTLVATYLMYWWGLGWFGEVSRVQQIWIVLLMYPLQVLVSVAWMRVFTIGPMEWLWRTLTYLRVQPVLRRREVAEAISPLS